MKDTIPKRRVKAPRAIEGRFLDTPDEATGRQMLLIRVNQTDYYYIAEPILGDLDNCEGVQLVGWRLWKNREESYCILIEADYPTCECMGFYRWGHCRHVDGLLKATGRPELFVGAEYKPGPNSDLAF